MHDVLNDKVLYPHFNLRLNNRPSRKGGLQFEIPKVKYKVGKESAQYRGQVIWNFSLKKYFTLPTLPTSRTGRSEVLGWSLLAVNKFMAGLTRR